MRDTAAWIKYAPDAPVKAQRALAFGSSQSGRFLRTFLYFGFNGDEKSRLVFDGVMAHISGASRLDLNRRWATPTGLGQFDATAFPFADQALRDPVTGAEEGALDNARAKDFKPKIFYTNTGVEYWGGARSAALIHTTPDGAKDLALPDHERVYFLTGSQHGPARFPPAEARLGAQRENPNDYWLTMRALLVAMDDWLRSNKVPPASRYPQLANATLVPAAKVAFPALPGVRAPQQLPAGPRAPNPLVAKDGAAGTTLPYLVPQTDKDGIELAGVRLPDIEAPLATYTGWNFRNAAIGGEDTLYPLLGSYIPFPATAAARTAAKDPRAAIAERYASKQAYLDKIRAAADKLVADRFLLADDLPAVLDRAGRHWDLLDRRPLTPSITRTPSQPGGRIPPIVTRWRKSSGSNSATLPSSQYAQELERGVASRSFGTPLEAEYLRSRLAEDRTLIRVASVLVIVDRQLARRRSDHEPRVGHFRIRRSSSRAWCARSCSRPSRSVRGSRASTCRSRRCSCRSATRSSRSSWPAPLPEGASKR